MVTCHNCGTVYGRAKNESVREGTVPINDFFGVPSAKTTKVRIGYATCPKCGDSRAMWREYPEQMSGRQWLNRQGGRWLD